MWRSLKAGSPLWFISRKQADVRPDLRGGQDDNRATARITRTFSGGQRRDFRFKGSIG